MIPRRLVTTLAALLVVSAAAAGEPPTRWLNVKVDAAEDNARVSVRVPLSVVNAVLNAIHTDEIAGGKILLDTEDADIDWPALMAALKDAPDAHYVKVESDDGNVDISKIGDTIRIDVRENGDENATVKILLPAAILDAVSIDEENRLDVGRLIAALDHEAMGDLVTVTAPDASVRIWID